MLDSKTKDIVRVVTMITTALITLVYTMYKSSETYRIVFIYGSSVQSSQVITGSLIISISTLVLVFIFKGIDKVFEKIMCSRMEVENNDCESNKSL